MSKIQLIFAAAVLGIALRVAEVNATCKECTIGNYAACINETAFYFCFDGKTKSDQVGLCTDGKVCTVEPGVCKLTPEFTADCKSGCNVCATAFACVSQTEFAMCDGGVPGAAIPCPSKKYCNIDKYDEGKGAICVDTCSNEPTCSNAEVEKPDPTKEYKSSCDGLKKAGYYPNKSDPSCKTYVYCETVNDVPYSILYTCKGYFNSETKKCVDTKPKDCTE